LSATGESTPDHNVARWLDEARDGSRDALGQLWETCRQYLLLVANQELQQDLQAKVGPSDLVQDTFLEAQRDFARFHGRTEAELLAWLRRILLNNLANTNRSYRHTGKRAVDREVALPELLASGAQSEPPAPTTSPSSLLAARERDTALNAALERLPEHYRQVVLWRNFDRLEFEAIGERLGRSPEAARKLWVRAIEQLQQLLESEDAP
jgi:RNA polymerase sigma-70 factor (ECF subfamily)